MHDVRANTCPNLHRREFWAVGWKGTGKASVGFFYDFAFLESLNDLYAFAM